jgi:hypothetical protein
MQGSTWLELYDWVQFPSPGPSGAVEVAVVNARDGAVNHFTSSSTEPEVLDSIAQHNVPVVQVLSNSYDQLPYDFQLLINLEC